MDAIKESRAKEAGYLNENAFLVGLARYDLMVRGKHSVTSAISRMTVGEQDDIDDFLFELNRRNLNVRGSFFQRLIKGDPTAGQDESGEVAAKVLDLAQRWRGGEDVFENLK